MRYKQHVEIWTRDNRNSKLHYRRVAQYKQQAAIYIASKNISIKTLHKQQAEPACKYNSGGRNQREKCFFLYISVSCMHACYQNIMKSSLLFNGAVAGGWSSCCSSVAGETSRGRQ